MSDSPHDDGARIFRAAIPLFPSGLSGRGASEPRIPPIFHPGRGWLELTIGFCAAALIAPLCFPGAVAAALLARRAGNARWLAGLIAAVWCTMLGVALRAELGMPVVP
ncbi:MAG TPA: hypothetical protein VK688_05770 [Gemmatimonadales bacterium]|jgi:hypothetical protein|nr:hypothetical protein [Gemmatimonadales bacterium]